MSVIDFQNKRLVKDGITPAINCLEDAIKQIDSLDIVLILSRTSDGDFKMWASGHDYESAEWLLIMEVCKNRMINGMFG